MSFNLVNDAWDTPMKSHAAKLVFVSLVDQMGKNGFCYPSIATIARRCCLSKRAVSAKIRELEAGGFLRVATQKGGSSHYVAIPKPERKTKEMPFASEAEPMHDVHGGHASGAGGSCTTFMGVMHDVHPNPQLTLTQPSLNPREGESDQKPESKPSPKGARPITEEWLETIKPLYPSIDINHQLERARAWCATKGKELSQQRFTNWLKKSKPIAQAQTLSDETAFGYIWNRYPRHRRPIEKQSEIFSVYNQTVPDDKTDEVCEAFDRFLASEDWTKQGGKFVPSIGKFFANELWMNPPAKTEPKSIL
jgi:hypothetical protein